jgi:hypothetical protein
MRQPLEQLGRGAQVVRDGRRGQAAERLEVPPIRHELWCLGWISLPRQHADLFEIAWEQSRHRGQIGIILGVPRCAHVKITSTDRTQCAYTTAAPPPYQSTCRAHMAPNGGRRIPARD